MEVIEVVVPYTRPDEFHLYCLGDIHYGTIHCAEHQVKAKIKEIQDDPWAKWIGMGDYGEFITPSDPRWSTGDIKKKENGGIDLDNIAECERKWIRSLFIPVKDKCIGLLYGNHEESLHKHDHNDVHQNICDDLELKNLGYSTFVHFLFHRKNSSESHLIKGDFTHGTGGARTPGGKINYLRDMMAYFDANIYGYGHVHWMQTHSPDIIGTNDTLTITSKGKIGVLTGCWFRTYTQGTVSSYGEKKGYPPSRIGSPMFRIIPNKGIVIVETPMVLW